MTLLRPDATVELDCDRGVLIGGCKTTPICEVELELKARAIRWRSHRFGSI